MVATTCVVTQLINKALDTFNAAIVSPIYYVMFTTLKIVASGIMFKDWSRQNSASLASGICGFITVVTDTIIHHRTRRGTTSFFRNVRWYDSRKRISEEHLISLYI